MICPSLVHPILFNIYSGYIPPLNLELQVSSQLVTIKVAIQLTQHMDNS